MKDPKLYMSSNILSHLKIPILNRILSMKLLKRNDNVPPKKSEKQKIRCRITLPKDPETNSPEKNSYRASQKTEGEPNPVFIRHDTSVFESMEVSGVDPKGRLFNAAS